MSISYLEVRGVAVSYKSGSKLLSKSLPVLPGKPCTLTIDGRIQVRQNIENPSGRKTNALSVWAIELSKTQYGNVQVMENDDQSAGGKTIEIRLQCFGRPTIWAKNRFSEEILVNSSNGPETSTGYQATDPSDKRADLKRKLLQAVADEEHHERQIEVSAAAATRAQKAREKLEQLLADMQD
ncbi:MAG: hypothetical protein Q9220_000281 [cf. Caloplaca sp. 1 TL-2023]